MAFAAAFVAPVPGAASGTAQAATATVETAMIRRRRRRLAGWICAACALMVVLSRVGCAMWPANQSSRGARFGDTP